MIIKSTLIFSLFNFYYSGESLARSQLFIFLVTLLQVRGTLHFFNYRILPSPVIASLSQSPRPNYCINCKPIQYVTDFRDREDKTFFVPLLVMSSCNILADFPPPPDWWHHFPTACNHELPLSPKKASLNQKEILNRRWKFHCQESAQPRARKTTAVMAPEYLRTFTFTLKRFEDELMHVN